MCCNFGCWHWLHVAVAAGVAFHWLRRERVRERDIFRLGNGTVVLLHFTTVVRNSVEAKVSPSGLAFAKSSAKSSATQASIPQGRSSVDQRDHGYGHLEGPAISPRTLSRALRNLHRRPDLPAWRE